MLTVQNVIKKYGKTAANDNVSLEVGAGEIALLVGPNGAGKTTLINCIAGLLRYKGNIYICEIDNRLNQAKKMIGFVPKIPSVYDLLTVYEHIEFIARAYELNDYKDYAKELLESFNLTDKKNILGRDLSIGMQKKLNIVCALLIKPNVLLMDEPLISLDPQAVIEVKNVMNSLKQTETSVLICTHLLNDFKELWDRIYFMIEGKVVASKIKTSKTKFKTLNLEDLFLDITGQYVLECGDRSIAENNIPENDMQTTGN